MSRRAVFLDRDGVLNAVVMDGGVSRPPASAAALVLLPDVRRALDLLGRHGLLRIVVTNQPDVARGRQTREAVDAIHERLMNELPLDAVLACFHDDRDGCACRKPKPGLLLQAAAAHGVDLARSFMVGDRPSDIEAGRAAGCRTFLVRGSGNGSVACAPDFEAATLWEATAKIVELTREQETVPSIDALRVKIFADGAEKAGMLELARLPYVAGFTTNPTLMRKAGIADYRAFARDVLSALPDRPISFEVFADEFDEMERQAHEIASWGKQVYVKIPVTNTRGESACALIRRLAASGVQLNVTAILTLEQVRQVAGALADGPSSYISVFAGRIADTGRDPVPLMAAAVDLLRPWPQIELIWASPRELLNIFQADAIGCHIITVTHDVLKRLQNVGKDLGTYSLETVRMFREDAVRAGYSL